MTRFIYLYMINTLKLIAVIIEQSTHTSRILSQETLSYLSSYKEGILVNLLMNTLLAMK